MVMNTGHVVTNVPNVNQDVEPESILLIMNDYYSTIIFILI